MMDISLNEGHMVGLIKEQDPMGNKDKWFIDDGSTYTSLCGGEGGDCNTRMQELISGLMMTDV